MDFLEKDLEEILHTTPQDFIRLRGLGCFKYRKLYRQVRVPPYGIIDLVSLDYHSSIKMLDIRVYELKNKTLNAATFWQVVRYLKAVQQIIKRFNLINHIVQLNGTMVGREISLDGEFCYLPTLNSNIDIYTYQYNYDGISFRYVSDSYFMKGFNGLNLYEFDCNSYAQLMRQTLTPLNYSQCQESEL